MPYHCVPSSPLPSSLTPIIQTDRATSALAILTNFGLEALINKFLEDGVHGLGNLLSLSHDVHCDFNTMELWLEGAGEVCYLWALQHYQLNTQTAQPLQGLRF